MITISKSVIVNQPVDSVFAYVSNSEHDGEWSTGTVTEVRKVSDGPLGVGTRFLNVHYFLGRRQEALMEVTAFEVPSRYSFDGKVGSGQVSVTFDFEPLDEGTRLKLSAQVETAGMFTLAEPVVAVILGRKMTTDLNALKTLLESPGGPVNGPVGEA